MSKTDAGIWFLPDEAIDDPKRDAFSHETLARQLAEAVRGCPRGSVVGLIGEFGTGKSSIAKLVKDLFGNDRNVDVIHVSADKHAEVARSRNITHSVGAEIKELSGVSEFKVDRALSALRSTVTVSGEAPAPEGVWQAIVGSYGGWPRFLRLAAALATLPAALLVLAALLDGPGWLAAGIAAAATALAVGTASVLLHGFKAMLERSLLGPTVQAQTQRAEAADDVEVVFERLVEIHHDSRKGRRLVVFIDDVDRLDRGEVLDALRAIKSLQHVPRGKEPTFVVACDENIVRHAIESSRDRPAGDPSDGPGRRSASEAARAYLDKFFSLRIPLPPHVGPDLRAYVEQVIPADHPIREHGIDLELLARVLVHRDVADPRHVIRLLNAFFAAYRLAVLRESADAGVRRINPGDVSDHPAVLARLTTLRTDFPKFYRQIVADHELLVAADQAAQGRQDTPHESLLRKYSYRLPTGDGETESSEAGGNTEPRAELDNRSSSWNPEEERLRRYLVATVHYVDLPRNLTPFIYLSHSAAGRGLGNELLTDILDALDGGDPERVSDLLNEVPDDQQRATADEIVERLRDATNLAARNLLVAIGPAVEQLEGGDELARAAADLIDRAAGVAIPQPETLRTLLDHVSVAQRPILHRELVRHIEDDPQATDARMRTAAAELPRDNAPVLRDAVADWLSEIRTTGSWRDFGHAWLTTAEQLGRATDPRLYDDHILPALIDLASETPQLGPDSIERLLALSVGWTPRDPDAESKRVCGLTRNDPELLRLTVGLTARGALPVTPDLAQRLAAASEAHAEDLSLVGQVLDELARDRTWAHGSLPTDDEDDEPIPLTRHVAGAIARAVAHSADGIDFASGKLSEFRELFGDEAHTIEQALLASLEGLHDEGDRSELTRKVGLALIDNVEHLSDDEAEPLVGRLLSPLREGTESAEAQVRNAVTFVQRLIPHDAARAALATEAREWLTAIEQRAPDVESSPIHALRHISDNGAKPLHEPFGEALDRLETRLRQQQQRARARSSIAVIPWPPAYASRALASLAAHWDQLDETSQSAALLILPAAGQEADAQLPEPVLATLLSRVADGDTTAARIANDIWTSISSAGRTLALVATATEQGPLRSRFHGLTVDETVELMRAASADGDLSAVLQMIDHDDELRSDAAERLLKEWVTEDHRPSSEQIDALVDQLLAGRVDRLVNDLVAGLREQPNPGALTAARSLNRAAARHSARPPLSDVERAVVEKLPESDTQLARELGRLARSCGIRDRGALAAALKNLVKSGNKPIMESFRDGFDGGR